MGYCPKLCCDQGARKLGADGAGTAWGEQAGAGRWGAWCAGARRRALARRRAQGARAQ